MEIQTPRLRLRLLCEEDSQGYGRLLADARVHPFVVENGPIPVGVIPGRIEQKQQQWADGTGVVLAVLRDQSFIGYVALHNLGRPKVAASYAIAVDWQRQGYCTEAVSAVLGRAREFAFTQVEARTHEGNEASVALLRAVGFVEVEPLEHPRRRVFLWRAGG